MKRWIAVMVLFTAPLGVVGWLGYRYVWSCKWVARDITGFSLRGQVRVESCARGIAARIVATLDSATTEKTILEAKGKGYLPLEALGDRVVASSVYQPLVGRRGWFLSTFGKNPNGGYLLVYLDVDKRVLSVVAYAN